MTSTETVTKPALSDDAPAQWPPKAHIILKKDQPAKEGTVALCGTKLMGIDLENAAVDSICQKCVTVAKRDFS